MSLKLVILPVGFLVTMTLVKYLNIDVNLDKKNITRKQERLETCAKLLNQSKPIGRQEGYEVCTKLVTIDILSCCKVMDFHWPSEEYIKSIGECRAVNMDNTQCQPDTCIAGKWDMLNPDDNALNETALTDFIMDRYPDNQLNYIITCINANVDNYDDTPDKSMCDLIRRRRCLVAQTIIGCSEFDATTNPALCGDIEYLADYCRQVYEPQILGGRKHFQQLREIFKKIELRAQNVLSNTV